MLGWARWGRRLLLAGAVALVSGTAAIAYVTHLEKDNQFCVACHRPDGKRLHSELFDRYEGKPPVNLSALHRHARKQTVKCIDCHAGAGVERRGLVLAIAAWDTLKYLADRFEEPKGMAVPLRDRECIQCHADYEAGPFPEDGQAGGRDFHKHPDHRALSSICVECHTAHVAGDPRLKFLNNSVVLPHCQRCHKEMGTEQYSG